MTSERQWFTLHDGALVIHAVTRRVWNDPYGRGGIMPYRRPVTRCGLWLLNTSGRIGDVTCMACIAAMTRSVRGG